MSEWIPVSEKLPTAYHQMLLKDQAESNPTFFMSGKKDCARLVEKAKGEAERILKEFSVFYSGDVGIEIGVKQFAACFSITATLTVNGSKVKEYDPCDLCFYDLNALIMKRMIDCGMVSFGGENDYE